MLLVENYKTDRLITLEGNTNLPGDRGQGECSDALVARFRTSTKVT